MKSKLLPLLRSAEAPVSGARISEALGVSRVAVWKQMQKLKAAGYRIEASPKGYRLAGSPDALYPWEFPAWEDRVAYHAEVSSTMDLARETARGGCPPFTVVVADRQKQGRGRLSRVWLSDAGGLYFTVVLRPQVPPALAYRVGFAASLVLVRLLETAYGIRARVKWPNDVLVGGRKICGILCEMEAEADRVAFVNLGVGINVNNDPGPAVPEAVSLQALMGRPVPRREVLGGFLDRLAWVLETLDGSALISHWKTVSETIGRRVRVVTTRETLAGRAIDVDETGALVLELEDGSRRKVFYGDCFHASGRDFPAGDVRPAGAETRN